MQVSDQLKHEYDEAVEKLKDLVSNLENVDLSDRADIESMLGDLDEDLASDVQSCLNAILDEANESEPEV